MWWKRIRLVTRARAPTWSTTRAAPPTARAPPQRHRAEAPRLPGTWRTQPNRYLSPRPCEYRARGIARRQIAWLVIRLADQQAESILRGLPARVGRASRARTVSLNSERSPSRWARTAASTAR